MLAVVEPVPRKIRAANDAQAAWLDETHRRNSRGSSPAAPTTSSAAKHRVRSADRGRVRAWVYAGINLRDRASG